MSYPQPIASTEVLQGQQFFRLFTELTSSGDIYEMDVSAMAFVIGPQSDIARARITYWDPEARGNALSFIASVGDPFIGRVDAFASQQFPIAKTAARVLISPEDLCPDGWFPSALGIATSIQQPRIDLLGYLSPPAAVPVRRADFLQIGRVSIAGTAQQLLYPYYRRHHATIKITNYGGLAGYTLDVVGVTFTPDRQHIFPFAPKTQDSAIVSSGAINAVANSTTTFTINASTDGLHDYLSITFTGPVLNGGTTVNGINYSINFSDSEE